MELASHCGEHPTSLRWVPSVERFNRKGSVATASISGSRQTWRVPSCGFERRNNGIDGINGIDGMDGTYGKKREAGLGNHPIVGLSGSLQEHDFGGILTRCMRSSCASVSASKSMSGYPGMAEYDFQKLLIRETLEHLDLHLLSGRLQYLQPCLDVHSGNPAALIAALSSSRVILLASGLPGRRNCSEDILRGCLFQPRC